MKKVKAYLIFAIVILIISGLVSCSELSSMKAELSTKIERTQDNGTTVQSKEKSNEKSTKNTELTTRPELTITTKVGDKPIKKIIERTTNAQGNPTKEFIKSLKGFTLTIKNPWEYYEKGTVPYDSAEYVKSIIEKKYGVIIKEDGYFEDYEDDLVSNISSRDKLPCVYKVRDSNFTNYIDNGYVASLNNAMKTSGVNFKDEWYLNESCQLMNINNNNYGWITFEGEFTFPNVIIYNKNHLKDAGLNDPYDLMLKGNWTWNEFENYSKKLSKSSKYKACASTNTSTFLSSMVSSKGGSLINIKNQKPEINLSDKLIKECFTKMKNWENNSIVDFCIGESWDYAKKQFAQGNYAMIYGSNDALNALLETGIKDSIGVVPFPKATASSTYINTYIPQYIDFIPYTVSESDRAKILFIRNEMYRYAYTLSDRDFKYLYKDFNFDSKTMELAYQMKYKLDKYPNKMMLNTILEPYKSDIKLSHILKQLCSGDIDINSIGTYEKDIQKEYDLFWSSRKLTGFN